MLACLEQRVQRILASRVVLFWVVLAVSEPSGRATVRAGHSSERVVVFSAVLLY